ncbi:hypothetical protein JCM11491_001382 [Sporobolomyces phaffii]
MSRDLVEDAVDTEAANRASKRPRLEDPADSINTAAHAAPSSRYELKCSLKGHQKAISSIEFSPDGQWLASASGGSPIHLHSLPSYHLYRSFHSHSSGVSHLSFSADSALLASASDDGTVRVWEIDPTLSLSHRALGVLGSDEGGPAGAKPEMAIRVLKGHLSAVFCVGWSPRGDLVASGGMDETVRVWDVQKGKCMKVLPAHSEPVSSVQFSRDGTMIVSGSWDGYIRIWDTATGQCLKTLVNEDNAPVSNVRFTPNSKFIFTSTLDSTIRLWDYQTDKLLKSYSGHVNRKYCIPSVLTRDGKYLLAGSEENNKVFKWDLQTRQIVDSFIAHKDVVIALAYHPTLPILATGGLEKDKSIKVWIDHDGVASPSELEQVSNRATTTAAATETTAGGPGDAREVEMQLE